MRTLPQIEASITVCHTYFVDLGQNYKDIRDGNFAEAWDAMGSNRNKRYREVMQQVLGYPTLEFYWKFKWGLTRDFVTKQIRASEIVKNLKDRLDETIVSPNSEGVARELIGLSPEKQVEAWQEAVQMAGGGQPTAKQTKEAVAKVKGGAAVAEYKELETKAIEQGREVALPVAIASFADNVSKRLRNILIGTDKLSQDLNLCVEKQSLIPEKHVQTLLMEASELVKRIQAYKRQLSGKVVEVQ